MKIITTIVNVLTYICYLLISIIILVSLPIVFGHKPVVVISGSMEPTYKVGSIIYYHHVKQEDIKKDDVITYQLQDDLVTHRVVKIEENFFYTQGDANDVMDAKGILYENIKGKVTKFSIPYIGYLLQYYNTHHYILVVIAFILILDFLLINRRKKQ